MFASVCVFVSVHVNFHVIDYYMTDSGHSSFNHVMYSYMLRQLYSEVLNIVPNHMSQLMEMEGTSLGLSR